jgi:hypothetical protein
LGKKILAVQYWMIFLEKELQIQADSNQKKADSEKTTSFLEKLVKETQVYNQAESNSYFVRVDALFSVNRLQEKNACLVQKNAGFSLLVNTTSEENLTALHQFSKQMQAGSGLTFRVIQLINEETCLIPHETLCLIRPDNFARILPLNLDNIYKSLDDSNHLLKTPEDSRKASIYFNLACMLEKEYVKG